MMRYQLTYRVYIIACQREEQRCPAIVVTDIGPRGCLQQQTANTTMSIPACTKQRGAPHFVCVCDQRLGSLLSEKPTDCLNVASCSGNLQT
mmetsp:Transcript_21992/g.41095  ORF Transcript_21992/g.41095 Transcript_21992/m.41095 type:complete len:91 (+) Transcript_21992:1629-1901(+)